MAFSPVEGSLAQGWERKCLESQGLENGWGGEWVGSWELDPELGPVL